MKQLTPELQAKVYALVDEVETRTARLMKLGLPRTEAVQHALNIMIFKKGKAK